MRIWNVFGKNPFHKQNVWKGWKYNVMKENMNENMKCYVHWTSDIEIGVYVSVTPPHTIFSARDFKYSLIIAPHRQRYTH